jgi:hypothetical protein
VSGKHNPKQPFMKSTIIFLGLFFLLSCNQDEPIHTCLVNTCLVKDPLTELDWLKAEIADRESNPSDLSKYFFISMAVYEGNTVFIFDDCCPMCDTISIVYNCTGEQIGYKGDIVDTITWQGYTIVGISSSSLKDSKVIWKTADHNCTG